MPKSKLFILNPRFYLETAVMEWLSAILLAFRPSSLRINPEFGIACAFLLAIAGVMRFQQWKTARDELKALSKKTYFTADAKMLHDRIVAQTEKGITDVSIYVGRGYIWETKHTARYHQIRTLPETAEYVDLENEVGGLSYIHNIGMSEEKELVFPIEELKHTIIAGTTRVGKTRMIEVLTYQIICSGQPLILVDPKGDAEMLDSIYAACVAAGRERDFTYMSLTHPEKSASINPVASYLKPADIATRVASILPQDAGSKPFTDFCWKVLIAVAEVMVAMEMPVTLKKLHKYSLQHMEDLAAMGNSKLAEFEDGSSRRKNLERALGHLSLLVDHPKDHFSKMITSLEPVMTALATGEIGELLSPEKPDINWEDVVKGHRVVYLYLASMVDEFTSSAVGKLVVQDILNYVGQIYAYETEFIPINLFVDEFYSVMFPGYVDILNKAGGAGMRVFLALQTTADITSAADMSMTKQILGNVNNKFYMRVPERDLAEEFCGLFGKVKIFQSMKSRAVSANPKSARELFNSNYSEKGQETEVDLLTPEMIMGLPKGQAFVFTQGRMPYKLRVPLLDRKTLPNVQYSKMVVNQDLKFSFAEDVNSWEKEEYFEEDGKMVLLPKEWEMPEWWHSDIAEDRKGRKQVIRDGWWELVPFDEQPEILEKVFGDIPEPEKTQVDLSKEDGSVTLSKGEEA